jgi:peptide/nickel transport system permease protein
MTASTDEKLSYSHESYGSKVWNQFRSHWLGMAGLAIVVIFCFAGIYAPFLASNKPIALKYGGNWYFPLFRYLFYTGFYTKLIDIFFNLLMFTLPLGILLWFALRRWRFIAKVALLVVALGHSCLFIIVVFKPPKDPAADPILNRQRQEALQKLRCEEVYPRACPSWDFDLRYMAPYAKINMVLDQRHRRFQHEKMQKYEKLYGHLLPTLWQMESTNEQNIIMQQKNILSSDEKEKKIGVPYKKAEATLSFLEERRLWLNSEEQKIQFEIMPLLRPFHWEQDAGGEQSFNQYIPWWEVTRINRKDLIAALVFGVRISLVVGIMSVSLALIIGTPIGAYAGYHAGKVDIVVSRLLEIWEAMPTFFMLLLVVAITQSKSIFLVIAVIGFFGWTSFSRYIRGEFFKQRNLSYVEACRSLGFGDFRIIFYHILPNAIPPVLTLLPFAIMGAITSEAGLSFLGLGEEGSSSWGVLMDEGRSAFPAESYLLWLPAILLTIFLVAIALVGDALRDAIDPKMHL